jgi:hypothetical protein
MAPQRNRGGWGAGHDQRNPITELAAAKEMLDQMGVPRVVDGLTLSLAARIGWLAAREARRAQQ